MINKLFRQRVQDALSGYDIININNNIYARKEIILQIFCTLFFTSVIGIIFDFPLIPKIGEGKRVVIFDTQSQNQENLLLDGDNALHQKLVQTFVSAIIITIFGASAYYLLYALLLKRSANDTYTRLLDLIDYEDKLCFDDRRYVWDSVEEAPFHLSSKQMHRLSSALEEKS